MHAAFKSPSQTPQDLLLIQDLIGDQSYPSLSTTKTTKPIEDCIESSADESSNADELSEDEVVADLLLGHKEGKLQSDSEPAESESSSSEPDSDSDSDSEDVAVVRQQPEDPGLEEDDDDTGTRLAVGAVPQTKNEILEANIPIPDIEEVGENEVLEKVGEVISTMERLVVIRGAPSDSAERGADRALDSGTLLVFDDRKVLGYIFETFGPTSQPFYQVKFTSNYPLDANKVFIGRDVFHVPSRSYFVFLTEIKRLKGSDASNLYDEEPADHELEFSDDEAEAEFKRLRKRKRGDSVMSSRFATPAPTQSRDQDLESEFVVGDAYAAHGPYDIDFGVGSSRPPPMPYDDDPYAEDAGSTPSDFMGADEPPASSNISRHNSEGRPSRGGGRSWASDRKDGKPVRGRGRGRGRGRARGESFGRARGNFTRSPTQPTSHSQLILPPPEGPQPARPLSPTSFAIARATGEFPVSAPPITQDSTWTHQAQYSPFEQLHHPYVQPHINPRFASMFGLQLPPNVVQPYVAYGHGANVGGQRYGQQPHDWTDEWTIHRPDGVDDPKP